MRRLGQATFIVVLFIIALLLSAYAALRTPWGMLTLNRWLSFESPIHLHIGAVEHHWRNPAVVVLKNVSFGDDGHPALLIATQIRLTLNWRQLFTPTHFSEIEIAKARLAFKNLTRSLRLPYSAERLSLRDVEVMDHQDQFQLQTDRLQASVSPWRPTAQSLLGDNFDYRLQAQQVQVNRYTFQRMTASGSRHDQQLALQLSGEVLRGKFHLSAQRAGTAAWKIAELQLDNLRFQTQDSPTQLLAQIAPTSVELGKLEINNSTVIGPNWSATNLTLQADDWPKRSDWLAATTGHLSLKAETLMSDLQRFDQPRLILEASPAGLTLKKFSAHWRKGTIEGQGDWSRAQQRLTLQQLNISNIKSPLAQHWLNLLRQPTPKALRELYITQFKVNNGLLIDITRNFPFQLTALKGKGDQLLLVQQNRWGLWHGTSQWRAAAATFNGQDIRAPQLTIEATPEQIVIRDLKMLIEQGPVIGEATFNFTHSPLLDLSAQGTNVPLNFLRKWGWPHDLQGRGNFQLQLRGPLDLQHPGSRLTGSLNALSDGKLTQQLLTH